MVTTLLLILGMTSATAAPKVDATKLIKRAEDQILGKTFAGTITMKIQRPDSERDMKVKIWLDGRDKALVKIVEPEKDHGIGNLRLNLDLWQYLPKVERLIKIPASMMLQSWMGSDFTNDDLVRSSSTYRDYEHVFASYEKINGVNTAKIILTPKPNAPVVWGKLEMWIEPKQAVLMKQDFYSEGGELVKSMVGSKVKNFGSHRIASHVEMKSIKKNTLTVLEYVEAVYDKKINETLFSQNNLKSSIAAR